MHARIRVHDRPRSVIKKMRLLAAAGGALALFGHRQPPQPARPRASAARLAVSDENVAEQLDDVPVFGIKILESGTLYGGDDGETMVYTSLTDASRVLAQLSSTYEGTQLEILPLPLGHVLTQAGILQRAATATTVEDPALASLLRGDEEDTALKPIELVASPEERKAARTLRENAALPRPRPRDGLAAKLQAVPIFHIGSVEDPSNEGEALWPFFFRTADVDALWREVGGGGPRPEVTATDLAALVDGLRQADAAPARPLVCGPLDALEFVRMRDDAALENAKQMEMGTVDVDDVQ